MQNLLRRRRIAVEMKLGGGGNVARFAPRAADHNDALQLLNEARIAVDSSRQQRRRSQIENRHFLGILSYQIANNLIGGMLVMQLRTGKIDAAKTAWSVQLDAVHVVANRQGR